MIIMSQTIFLEYFDMVIEELVNCKYCHKEIVEKVNDICEACELSLELQESLMALAEA